MERKYKTFHHAWKKCPKMTKYKPNIRAQSPQTSLFLILFQLFLLQHFLSFLL